MSKAKTKILGHAWGFSKLWNESLLSIPDRVMERRNYMYASELGQSFVDRYLKMWAIKPTNPPNDRSRRKFSSGHCWEWIVGLVLTMCGVLKEKQLRGEVELPGLLKVSGRLDFIAGGEIDWEKARAEVERVKNIFTLSINDMPPFIFHAIGNILSGMEKEFGRNPLKEVVFECKTVSSFMSDKLERTKVPMPHHVLQCMHYLLANKMDESLLAYVCKDDCIIHEFRVPNNKASLKFYYDDVKQMTEYYNASNVKNPLKTLPPLEPEILYSIEAFRFEANFKCEYSPYLKMLYNLDTPEAYRLKWAKSIASWNRVFKRVVRGDNITPANVVIIKEAVKQFPQWDNFVLKAKAAGAFQTAEENEDE